MAIPNPGHFPSGFHGPRFLAEDGLSEPAPKPDVFRVFGFTYWFPYDSFIRQVRPANTASLLVLLLAGWGVSNKLACLMKCMTPAACVRGTRCPREPPTNCTVRQRIGTLLHGHLSGVVLGEVANSHGALQRERLHGQTRGSRGDQVVALA